MGFDGDALFGGDGGPLVGAAFDCAATVGDLDGYAEADVEFGGDGDVEGVGDPVFEFLGVGGFEDGDAHVLVEEAGVGGDLGGFAPGVVAGDDDRAAGVEGDAGEVAEGEGVGGDVEADGFEDGDGLDADH